MWKRVGTRVLVAVAVASAGALAFACSGSDDKLALDEYFATMEELSQSRADQGEALALKVGGLDESDVAGALALERQQIDLVDEFAQRLREIDPPDKVADVHNAAIENLDAAADSIRAQVDAAPEADSVGALIETFSTLDFSKIEAADENCRELERIAADNGIEANLRCSDGG